MKRKWKWLLSICLPVLFLAACLWIVSAGRIPIEIVGDDIPDNEGWAIISTFKRHLRQSSIPDFSWNSLKQLPAYLKSTRSIKLYSIEPVIWDGPGASNIVLIHAWRLTNGLPLASRSIDTMNRRTWSQYDQDRYFYLAQTNATWKFLQWRSDHWEVMP